MRNIKWTTTDTELFPWIKKIPSYLTLDLEDNTLIQVKVTIRRKEAKAGSFNDNMIIECSPTRIAIIREALDYLIRARTTAADVREHIEQFRAETTMDLAKGTIDMLVTAKPGQAFRTGTQLRTNVIAGGKANYYYVPWLHYGSHAFTPVATRENTLGADIARWTLAHPTKRQPWINQFLAEEGSDWTRAIGRVRVALRELDAKQNPTSLHYDALSGHIALSAMNIHSHRQAPKTANIVGNSSEGCIVPRTVAGMAVILAATHANNFDDLTKVLLIDTQYQEALDVEVANFASMIMCFIRTQLRNDQSYEDTNWMSSYMYGRSHLRPKSTYETRLHKDIHRYYNRTVLKLNIIDI